jgi:hypothetical protein
VVTIRSFSPVPEEDRELFIDEMAPALSNCTDVLPSLCCELLDLP